MTEEELLQIARHCPLLQHVEILVSGAGAFTELIADVPSLHTLVTSKLDELTLLEIAARGHPSLRVLDTVTSFTYTGLRQVTAALPQRNGSTCFRISCEYEYDYAPLETAGFMVE